MAVSDSDYAVSLVLKRQTERDLSEDGKERSSEMRTRRRTFLPFALGRPTTASDIWRRAGSILTPKSFFLAYFSYGMLNEIDSFRFTRFGTRMWE